MCSCYVLGTVVRTCITSVNSSTDIEAACELPSCCGG
jgi:hypothetical protein